MRIGIPKEIKEHEYRVSLTPAGVEELLRSGHQVFIEHAAGMGSGFSDDEYRAAGAEITDKKFLFENAELIVKVKEPLPQEYDFFHEGQALFTYLHLAPNQDLIHMLLKKKIAGFAYETLEINNELPLLKPMSEIAGKMAPVMAAYYLQKKHGGAGILITGSSGVKPAAVLILGAGTVGMGALEVSYGMGAIVTVMNRGEEKLKLIDRMYEGRVRTVRSIQDSIASEIGKCDILIGAVLVTGARAPRLVSRDMVAGMKKGSVIVDVSVDQGGCIETTKPTTHTNPVYTVDGIVHYTVANMPGAYPRTSTLALTSSTLEYIQMIANNGIEKSAAGDGPLRSALNTYKGEITHKAVAGELK